MLIFYDPDQAHFLGLGVEQGKWIGGPLSV